MAGIHLRRDVTFLQQEFYRYTIFQLETTIVAADSILLSTKVCVVANRWQK